MSPRQTRLKELFAEALSLHGAQREAYLKKACGDDHGLRLEVEGLLAHDSPAHFADLYSNVSGQVAGHYQIGEQIGHGSMGQVYRATDSILGRPVALKFLPPWQQGNVGSRQQLAIEAAHIAALNHPNIVTIYEIAEHDGVNFIVMENIKGKTLDLLIPKDGLRVEDALDYARQITDALAAAHKAGILHGDLKPRNIMITDEGLVKLLDFGLAHLPPNEAERSKPWNRVGSSSYMAPEQLAEPPARPDSRSEIFTLGIILHEMLSGRHPFGPGWHQESGQAIRSETPQKVPPHVPAQVAAIVERCLATNPEQRFASARDLLAALAECAGNKTAHAGHVHLRQASTAEIECVRDIATRITHSNFARSRQAFTELGQLINDGASSQIRAAAAEAIKEFIINLDIEDRIIPNRVREIRKLALQVLKTNVRGELGPYFKDAVLEHLDLYGMNFSSAHLEGVSFNCAFLVEAEFENSRLIGSSFAGASLRNANFEGANLMDADFSDADWFNALGLTADQLLSVQSNTLISCPSTIEAMHNYLDNYAFPFASYPPRLQKQLMNAWAEYLRPGGLKDFVDR